ncbi:MAG: thioredoxin family protein [Planctomycetota bacterium]|jgi:thioredoxin 1
MDARKVRSLVLAAVVIIVVAFVAWQESRASTSTANPPAAERSLPRVIDIGAGTCKPCLEMIPVMDAVKAEFEGRAIVELIDIREDADAKQRYRVKLIPTQIFFDRDGHEVWRHQGFLAKEEIVKRLAELEQ